MPLKNIVNDKTALTYSLEAILGITLILSTVLFVTGNLPDTAQNRGELSKVQLVNIGRDVLDLVELTPVTDMFGNYSQGAGVNRQYLLVANKTLIQPGESVNFTVYYIDTDDIAYVNLTLEKTILGLKTPNSTMPINGNAIWNFSQSGEYGFIAYEGPQGEPTGWSNIVTITVGSYFLDTDINGIFENGSKIVDGVVTDIDGSGAPDLTIQILDSKRNPFNSSATNTSYGTTIEGFENEDDWNSSENLSLSTTSLQGTYSLSLDASSDFWIERTNKSYQLSKYDILSFYFYSPTGHEQIHVELVNQTNTSKNFVWNNIKVTQTGWNKIHFNLREPDSKINITAEDVDSINISVSNVTGMQNYYFDDLTAGEGKFSFIWPDIQGDATGSYYLQAVNTTNNLTSNMHRIVFTKIAGSRGFIYALDETIYETESTKIILIPKGNSNLKPPNFNVNGNCQEIDEVSLVLDPDEEPYRTVKFTGHVAGDYYIFWGTTGCGEGQETDPADAAKTNSIIITVLPLVTDCIFGDCIPRCGGLNMTELTSYLENFVPEYINYNLYLINPDGSICKDCPEFNEIINGYPTDEAVTVNKILHIKYQKKGVEGEYLEGIKELRMTLWYK